MVSSSRSKKPVVKPRPRQMHVDVMGANTSHQTSESIFVFVINKKLIVPQICINARSSLDFNLCFIILRWRFFLKLLVIWSDWSVGQKGIHLPHWS